MKVWTVDDVKGIVAEFAQSQGFYGRLYRDLEETDGWGRLAEAANAAGCADTLDLILLLES